MQDRRLFGTLARLRGDARGAAAIEYGLIISLMMVAMVSAMSATGSKLNNVFSNLANNLQVR